MNYIPQLVRDTETGKICIQIKTATAIAVHELPDNASSMTEPELYTYIEGIVKDMLDGLSQRKTETRRKIMKKAKQ